MDFIPLIPKLPPCKLHWPHKSWNNYFRRLSIGKKIGLGYATALAVALAGTMSGITWAQYHQRLATEYADNIRTQTETIQRLQLDALESQLELRSLITYTSQPNKFIATNYKLRRSLKKMSNDLQQLKVEPMNDDDQYQKHLSTLIDSYASSFDQYEQRIDQLVFDIDQSLFQNKGLTSTEIQKINTTTTILKRYSEDPLIQKFNQLPRRLSPLAKDAQVALTLSQQQLTKVERRSHWVIVWSFALSTLLAGAIAYFINRAVTQPIQRLTVTARDSIQSANFDLQVPVTTEDEIGILTVAFNEYIHGVKQLLQERQETERQLIQSEKLSSLGQLVAGIAHEINNPINFIYGNLGHLERYNQDLFHLISALEQKLKVSPEITLDDIDRIKETIEFNFIKDDLPKVLGSLALGAERIQTIVKGLRTFSRLNEVEMKTVNIHDEIENTLLILQHRSKTVPGLHIRRDYDKFPYVECYSGELNQVFMNILTNSIDALEGDPPEHPQITIQTRHILSKDAVVICIKDNGPGIPENIQNKIFNPFFTTKEVGKGTGLGMSISHQIITERHQGTLNCHSTLGKGAEFIIEIPVRQSLSPISHHLGGEGRQVP